MQTRQLHLHIQTVWTGIIARAFDIPLRHLPRRAGICGHLQDHDTHLEQIRARRSWFVVLWLRRVLRLVTKYSIFRILFETGLHFISPQGLLLKPARRYTDMPAF